jgi:ribonuclease HI
MGIGVVLLSGPHRKEISEFLGPHGTNNIAELTAIERALEAVKDKRRSVIVYSDSSYAIGVLSQGWKAKANVELVARIRALVATFSALRFVKVRGHAGVPENERCDELAREAIERGA